MKKTPLKKVSDKRKAETDRFYALDRLILRPATKGRSELNGERGDWRTGYSVEPHHITGRRGARVYDPFNIIYLTRPQHDAIRHTWEEEEELLGVVREIRIKQGFEEQ